MANNEHAVRDQRRVPVDPVLAPHGWQGTCSLCERHLMKNPMMAGQNPTPESIARLLDMRLMKLPDIWQHVTTPGDLVHKAMLNKVGDKHAMADMRGAAELKHGEELTALRKAGDWTAFLADATAMKLDFDQARALWKRLEGK